MRQIFFSLSTEYQNSYSLMFIYNSTIIAFFNVASFNSVIIVVPVQNKKVNFIVIFVLVWRVKYTILY